MTLDDMRIFVTIVNTGSFTSAAERLMLSKQFVSRRVAALETGLSAQLLVRNTRRLSVTDVGQVFFNTPVVFLMKSGRQKKLFPCVRASWWAVSELACHTPTG